MNVNDRIILFLLLHLSNYLLIKESDVVMTVEEIAAEEAAILTKHCLESVSVYVKANPVHTLPAAYIIAEEVLQDNSITLEDKIRYCILRGIPIQFHIKTVWTDGESNDYQYTVPPCTQLFTR